MVREDKTGKNDFFKKAYENIPQVLKKNKVVTDREIKVRLEGEAFPGSPGPFPWITGFAINDLINEKIIKINGYPGRRRIKSGETNKFYSSFDESYLEIKDLIKKKIILAEK